MSLADQRVTKNLRAMDALASYESGSDSDGPGAGARACTLLCLGVLCLRTCIAGRRRGLLLTSD